MRAALAETLTEVAERDDRIMFLTGDLGYRVFEEFERRFGPRYVNVGIAEAQIVCAAAGLALEGMRPVCYSIASFLTGRAFEQIRVSVGYPGLPVVLVGAGGGLTYAASGVTHHAAEDVPLMCTIPGMTVVTPGDPREVRELLPQLLQLDGPAYMRVGKFGEPVIAATEPAVLGRARCVRSGERIAILTSGDLTAPAADAADALAADGIRPTLYHFHTVKPLDTEALDRLAIEAHTLIVVEETFPSGGLAAAVAQRVAERQFPARLLRLGPPDALALGNCTREDLRAAWGYDAAAVAQACREAWAATIDARIAA